MKQNRENEALPAEPRPRPGLGIGEIDAKSVIPDDSVLELEELYKKQKQNSGPQKIRIKTKKEEKLAQKSQIQQRQKRML